MYALLLVLAVLVGCGGGGGGLPAGTLETVSVELRLLDEEPLTAEVLWVDENGDGFCDYGTFTLVLTLELSVTPKEGVVNPSPVAVEGAAVYFSPQAEGQPPVTASVFLSGETRVEPGRTGVISAELDGRVEPGLLPALYSAYLSVKLRELYTDRTVSVPVNFVVKLVDEAHEGCALAP
ncbi:MAG: hypothetical protein GXO03_01840 [Aquificae bacterium]|nr:hypothetical protein [Aquificota bacterium]